MEPPEKLLLVMWSIRDNINSLLARSVGSVVKREVCLV